MQKQELITAILKYVGRVKPEELESLVFTFSDESELTISNGTFVENGETVNDSRNLLQTNGDINLLTKVCWNSVSTETDENRPSPDHDLQMSDSVSQMSDNVNVSTDVNASGHLDNSDETGSDETGN